MDEIGNDIDRPARGFPLLRVLAVAALVIVLTAASDGVGATPKAAPDASPGPGRAAARFIGPTLVPGAPLVPAAGGPASADGDPTTTSAARTTPAAFTTALPDGRARVAIATAMTQIGLPYVWGGDGPTAGEAGFDCSGLTTFSYRAAGVRLPRTAHTQYYAGPHVPPGAPLQPGDLVFYGTPSTVHHVGMYIGAGRMVNAPRRGKPVQTAYYRWRGDDYLGATRPAATGRPTTGVLPAPPPATPDAAPPTEFAAPPAPLPVTPLPDPTVPQPPEPATAAEAIAATGGLTTTGPLPFPPPVALPPATAVPAPAPTGPFPPPPTTTGPAAPDPPITSTGAPRTPAAPSTVASAPSTPSTTPVPPRTTTPPPTSSPTRSAPPPPSPAGTSSAPAPRSPSAEAGITPTPTLTPTPPR